MIKLYKEINNEIHYAECWTHDNEATIHTGKIGTTGNTQTNESLSEKETYDTFLKEYLPLGYRIIPVNEHDVLVIQFPIKKLMMNSKELSSLKKAESLLNEALGWKGLGIVDGYDSGRSMKSEDSYVVNIFCFVVNSNMTIDIILEELKKMSFFKEMIIAVRHPESEDYTIKYPSNKIKDIFYL